MKKTVELFKKILKQSIMPLSDQTVSEWADSYRMISGDGEQIVLRIKKPLWMLLLNQA